jgi:dsDNA-specific endonuclease/ATPase MutS2
MPKTLQKECEKVCDLIDKALDEAQLLHEAFEKGGQKNPHEQLQYMVDVKNQAIQNLKSAKRNVMRLLVKVRPE